MNRSHFVRAVNTASLPGDDAYWFTFVGDRLLLAPHGEELHLPDTATLTALGVQAANGALLGYLNGVPCFAGDLHSQELPPSLRLVELRETYGVLPELEYTIAGHALQLLHWDRTTRFCPVCASPTQAMASERAKRCPECGYLQYPRVSPAIIVLVYRAGQVLLTRQASWPPNRYSLIAGFVEQGESLEECVRREVAEEVGVAITELRYLGSQPWPYPHQIMLGFRARYDAGELIVDPHELEHAAWFDLDALPDLPPPYAISRQILDWHMTTLTDPDPPFPL